MEFKKIWFYNKKNKFICNTTTVFSMLETKMCTDYYNTIAIFKMAYLTQLPVSISLSGVWQT